MYSTRLYGYIQYYEEDIMLKDEAPQTLFKLKFVQWKESLHKELQSYYINERGEEKFKE